MKLIYRDSGLPVQVGDEIAMNNATTTVESFPPPHKPASEGRVYLASGASYYVSVIGAVWIDREDRCE